VTYPIGIVISFVSVVVSILTLKQNFSSYFDHVGFMVVFGGTLSISAVAIPWRHKTELFRMIRSLFFPQTFQHKAVVAASLKVATGDPNASPSGGLYAEVLADGVELVELGLKTEDIHAILRERIDQAILLRTSIIQAIRGLSKYPPAFGLLGTVLGLVSLMRAVSSGAGSEEVGVRMAVALVATLYGLILANVVIAPAAEALSGKIQEETRAAEIAIQAVLLASQGVSALVAQEMLNSYVPRYDRVDALGVGGVGRASSSVPSNSGGADKAA